MIALGTTYAEALAAGRAALAKSPTAALDARVLLEEATGLTRAELIAADRSPLAPEAAAKFAALVERRCAGEPVAYIIGRQEFFGLDFEVSPDVLIPRPESEMLVDAARALAPRRVLDLGTGSGCLLLASLHGLPGATGVGIDLSAAALRVARRNAKTLRLSDRAIFTELSFADAQPAFEPRSFDAILANPPYISPGAELPRSVIDFEPRSALFAEEQGLAAHREVAAAIAALLTPQGSAFIEIGADQGDTAQAIYADALPGRTVGTKKDAAGLPRMVAVSGHAD